MLPGHLYALISGQAGKDREKEEKTGNGKERTSGRYPAWAEQNPSAPTGTSLRCPRSPGPGRLERMAFVRRNRGAGRQKRKSWHSQGGTKRQHESQSKVRFGSGTLPQFAYSVPISSNHVFAHFCRHGNQPCSKDYCHTSLNISKTRQIRRFPGIGPQILQEADHGIASPVEKFTKKSGKNSFMNTISISS